MHHSLEEVLKNNSLMLNSGEDIPTTSEKILQEGEDAERICFPIAAFALRINVNILLFQGGNVNILIEANRINLFFSIILQHAKAINTSEVMALTCITYL